MLVDVLLKRLEEEQASVAKEALQRPQGRDSFEYGRMAGMHAGLERAKDLLLGLIAEKDARDFDL